MKLAAATGALCFFLAEKKPLKALFVRKTLAGTPACVYNGHTIVD